MGAGTRRGVDEAIALAFAFGGPANPGWRFVSVWDSQDALDRFVAERLLPAYEQLGLSYDAAERTLFDVHKLVAGDLTGAPQPA